MPWCDALTLISRNLSSKYKKARHPDLIAHPGERRAFAVFAAEVQENRLKLVLPNLNGQSRAERPGTIVPLPRGFLNNSECRPGYRGTRCSDRKHHGWIAQGCSSAGGGLSGCIFARQGGTIRENWLIRLFASEVADYLPKWEKILKSGKH